MIVVAITDIHGSATGLARLAGHLAAADVVLLTGDLTHFGRRKDAARVLEAAREHSPRVLAVAGNCDHPEVTDYLEEQEISLHGRHVTVEGVAFLGLGGSLPCPARTPNEFTEAELAAFLEDAASGLDRGLPWVLVSHQPPRDTAVDRVHSGQHVGSESVRAFTAKYQPLACFTGHIHEGRGTDCIGRTKVVNPGPASQGRYAYARIAGGLEALEIRQI